MSDEAREPTRKRGWASRSPHSPYWICPDCGQENHYSSDWCYVSPGCLAKYWRAVSRTHQQESHWAALLASKLEAEAAGEVSSD